MKLLKKLISVVTMITIVLGGTVIANAQTVDLYEKEYEERIACIMESYFSNPQKAKEELEELNTKLEGEPTVIEHRDNANMSAKSRATSPTDYQLTVYSFSRGGVKYYLQWNLKALKTESRPGPLDYISLEWDTKYGNYDGSNGDGKISTVANKTTGIVLFNIEDNKLKKGNTTYGTVTIKKAKAGRLEYGSKFTHTYTKTNVSGSASYGFSPSSSISLSGDASLGLSYTYGYKVNVSSSTVKWALWNDNYLTF